MLLLQVARDEVLQAIEENEVVVTITPGRRGSVRLLEVFMPECLLLSETKIFTV